MNVGIIVEVEMLKVWLCGWGGVFLGEVEEVFVVSLMLGDSFLIGGCVVWMDGLCDMVIEVMFDFV